MPWSWPQAGPCVVEKEMEVRKRQSPPWGPWLMAVDCCEDARQGLPHRTAGCWWRHSQLKALWPGGCQEDSHGPHTLSLVPGGPLEACVSFVVEATASGGGAL